MARKDGKPGRIAQIRQTYTLTKQNDPKIGLILAGVFLAVFAVFLVIAAITKGWFFWPIIGFMFAVLAAMIVFGRRAERSAYASIEGQPGAAAAVLNSLRKGWFVTPGVAVTKNQDVVHRVVGKTGVTLVSEGPSARATSLLRNEHKKTQRFVPDVPIIEIQSGNEEGQVPLRKLNRAVMKNPGALKGAQVAEVRRRLEALGNTPAAMPKGPMPKSTRVGRPRG